ncbi:D-glycero-D-manno-heptose 1,7-bisphosphate phosphatasee [Prochlorococcus sp. SS52]|uniref:D,D-heptose 1,7-bisphosphate phosphatase n=2 Tax=Prochlorococcus TaxID=1218 RepID=Q7VAY5_PROMA|nr:HAD family hydrolase [Prochlorococcus marinus]KGG37307.1 D-glycero-D-manno-heptose 1,7-bisphosphate phosphatasee [Prochlorococcus sp. SS52]AAQ00362.1 Phosphatase, HAD superfamily [Prochlorococcus marinus subsp. marinus str. CCMP1375]KGG14242.1 D-glycero-D-manno-heptose 1,7-bisphosphate phosphatasee [Prochlorococcus marinus str. LG]KGG22186.1 D-glycero-D-manno-heptose 1,7-bisphosphate phosphatasee [Prochlorococcus marinus str. SS2]KGG24497.1 D-glycero-D-manno-heptose 1,7-bisphosphate phospha
MNKDYSNFISLFYDNPLYLPESMGLRPALFLDRDGVIIKDCHFVSNQDDVILEKGCKDFFKEAKSLNIPIIIITNQSGISRGYFGWDNYIEVTNKMIELIGEENSIIGIYANGQGPESPLHSWRKPSPNMILNSAITLSVDLSKSLMIGDRISDLQSAARAGIKSLIHIKTGHGKDERSDILSQTDGQHRFIDKNNRSDLILIDNLESFPFYKLSSFNE